MRQAILISRRTGRPSYWVQWRGWWLRVNRLARSPEELESLGRRLARADVDAPGELKGMLFFNQAMLRRKGELVVVCSQCGAAPAEREGRCVWCQQTAGGGSCGEAPSGCATHPAAGVAPSGVQTLGQRAAGGKAGGGTQGGSGASPAAAVAPSGAQALGQRAAGGKAGGGTRGGSGASPAAAVIPSGAQAPDWCQDLPIYQGVGTA